MALEHLGVGVDGIGQPEERRAARVAVELNVPGWAAKASGSKPRRLVNRHASSRLEGTGSAS